MRTDSVNIADTALREIAELVTTEYGEAYALAEPRRYKTQEPQRAGGARGDPAHERAADARSGWRASSTATSCASTP